MTIIMRSDSRLLTIWIPLFLCLIGLSRHAAATTDPSDLATLQSLYDHWSSLPDNHMPQWSGDDPCGSNWAGVVCDESTSTRVVQLHLLNFNLTGGIPSIIGDLASLEWLDLSYNMQLGGSLPPELGNLTLLTNLAVMQSGITGSIPSSLGQCKNLTFLALNQNGMSGPIPSEIGSLQNLHWFDISDNFIEGPLPIATASSLGLDNLTAAQHFHFYNNSITGSIPKELFNLPLLLHLLLDGNFLQGQIPSTTLLNAGALRILRLNNNSLNGPIPEELNYVTTLIEIHLGFNFLSGLLPDLSGLSELQLLDVGNNSFTPQGIPIWVYSMTSLQTLNLDSSNLTGELNSSIFNLPDIQTISLSHNSLNGGVSLTGNLSSTLSEINLQNNDFNTFSNGANFSGIELWLAGNPFCAQTFLSGSPVCTPHTDSPSSWAASPNSSCSVKSCSIGETLNPNRCTCAQPLVCNMSLTSPPFLLVNSSVITILSNKWAVGLNLDPSQVYIPSANFTSDSRMMFSLFFFPLSGDALTNSESNMIVSALSSNAVLIEDEGPYVMLNYLALAPLNSSKKSKDTALIIGIVVAAVAAAIIVALIALYAIRQKRRADKAEVSRPFASWGRSTGDPGEAPELKGAKWFSLADLRKATNNFDEAHELGIGGYGKVYRGELTSGRVVAVKRAQEGSMQGDLEFKTEIELLSRVHHRNLVGLVGFCYEQGEQMLVYEFMPNGTLRDHLLGMTDLPLTWDSRVAIALGSAKGLAYLHEHANPPIIHRDVKSANILLDEKMVAKVADFGLSKLAPDGADKKLPSTQVKGTMGYLDPEYYMTNHLSEKSDVYSFGVVLLEILSARPPIERGRYIVREVRTALNKGGMNAMEPVLDPFLGDYPPKQLEAFLNVALVCVEEAAAQRPTMNEVVKRLEHIASRSRRNSDKHITVERQKPDDDLYATNNLKTNSDPAFEYSGVAPFRISRTVEPK